MNHYHVDDDGEPKACRNALTCASFRRNEYHLHRDAGGFFHRCYHTSVSVLRQPSFWVGSVISTIVSFPFEHFLYMKVWPFYLLTKLLGLD